MRYDVCFDINELYFGDVDEQEHCEVDYPTKEIVEGCLGGRLRRRGGVGGWGQVKVELEEGEDHVKEIC